MRSTRRGCLTLMSTGAVGLGISAQNARAAETVSVTGAVESEIGASVEGSLVEFVSPEARHFEKAPIEDGRFETTLESGAQYHVTFWHEIQNGGYKTEFDGVPIHYDLEQDMRIDDNNTDLGTYEISEGHETQVRFEDTNGNPIRDLHVGFRTSGGSGTGPQSFFTNSEGYVYHDDEDDTGVELVGEIIVEVQSPRDHTDNITPQRLSVTEDREWTIALQNPEEWGGTAISTDSGQSDGSGSTEMESASSGDQERVSETRESQAEQDSTTSGTEARATAEHRGFFTNDPNSSIALLDDPVTITWGGIVVSIVGITMQLLGGDS